VAFVAHRSQIDPAIPDSPNSLRLPDHVSLMPTRELSLLSAVAVALSLNGSGIGSRPIAPAAAGAGDTSSTVSEADRRCVTRRGGWAPVPFRAVNLDTILTGAGGVVWGPATRVLVTDSAAWPAVWKRATDPSWSPDTIWLPDGRDSIYTGRVSVPPLRFGLDRILLLTTKVVKGPISLRISSIRRCRGSGTVVVTTVEDRSGFFVDMPGRAILAARVPRRSLENATVAFATEPAVPAEPPVERRKRTKAASRKVGQDSVPAWIYADSNLVEDTTVIAGRVAKRAIIVAFDGDVPLATRMAAIALVNGTIVGGITVDDEGGRIYYVRVSADTPAAILATVRVVAKAPRVGMAIPIMSDEVRPDQPKRKARPQR